MNEPIRLAFLGCGGVTRKHSKTLAGLAVPVNCYYASRDGAKAESYNKQFGGHGSFGSYDDAIASDEIDAVLLAMPPVQHLEQALLALRAGKHVIVEKPPFLHAKNFDEVQDIAEKNGRQVYVAENYFYKPLLKHLQELLRSDVIGEILFMHFNALKQQKITDWRADAEISGGGALFEGGIHWVNFISNLGLELTSVEGFRPGRHEGMEQSMLVGLRYREGAVGSFYYSWEVPSLLQGLRISKIYGRQGSITFESNGLFVIVRGKKKKIIFPGLKDIAGYKSMFEDFIKAMQENRPAQFTTALAKKDLETIEAVYESVARC